MNASLPGLDLPDDVVIAARHVSKKFCRNLRRSMWYGSKGLLRNLAGLGVDGRRRVSIQNPNEPANSRDDGAGQGQERCRAELRKDEFWALDDVSFQIKRGESVGVIGVNGSGKTTLLRLLSGIFPPDAGSIAVRGRIGALIALGAGFHPYMTGRENARLNGSILGIQREDIDARMDDIIAFSEIGEFIDAPVSTYSSGMKIRLGFAVAVHVEPDILLTDEVLAVGDIAFRNKCLRYMRKFQGMNRTLLLVSHNMPQIQSICDRAILLDRGAIVAMGEISEVVVEYHRRTGAGMLSSFRESAPMAGSVVFSDDRIAIRDARIRSDDGSVIENIVFEGVVIIEVDLDVQESLPSVLVTLTIESVTALVKVAFARTRLDGVLPRGRVRVEFRIPCFSLQPGLYSLGVGLSDYESREKIARVNQLRMFNVVPRAGQEIAHSELGYVEVQGEWRLESGDRGE